MIIHIINKNKMKSALIILGVLIALIVIAVVMALPTLWLWNWLMPIIFCLPEITFWQALGVNIFTGILFRFNVKWPKD